MKIRNFAYKCLSEMKTTKEILNALKIFKLEVAPQYGITTLGLFGSVAREQQHEGSDVDVFFDGKTPTLQTIARMEMDLERRIGSPVQMTMLHDKLPENFLNNIKKDAIYV